MTPQQVRRTNREISSRILHIKIDNVLRNFHRNGCYPEADDTEIWRASEAILRAFREEPIER